MTFRRSTLWEPAGRRRDRRVKRGLLIGCTLVAGLGLWLSPSTISKSLSAKTLVRELAFERYPAWQHAHPMQNCPPRLGDLGSEVLDPWSHALRYTCDRRLMHHPYAIAIVSAGEDGSFGTADDIRSLP